MGMGSTRLPLLGELKGPLKVGCSPRKDKGGVSVKAKAMEGKRKRTIDGLVIVQHARANGVGSGAGNHAGGSAEEEEEWQIIATLLHRSA